MNDYEKKGLITLAINAVMLILNGLISIFNPTTQKVAMQIVQEVFNA